MRILDVGSGPPVVVIPGIQGRWEWMKPGINALAERCRVITFSLADERGCGAHFDPAAGFDCYVRQVRDAMDACGIERAAICGVSYGGLVAAVFAARHPERVTSLVLVSAVPPSWTPDRRVKFYLRAPRLLTPLFCIASVRMYREIAAATPGLLPGVWAAVDHGWRALTHMFSPARMARRVRLLEGVHASAELTRVEAPTLIVTGDSALDRVVPVRRTREYLEIWPAARIATIEHTGHLGLITRPDEFTRIVAPFVGETASAFEARRRVG
jgi:pimeloyl-ACP methyl ester carboxylesterase